MPSYSPEQIKPVADERLVDQLSLSAKIAILKSQPNAPQGDERFDFKTAVYLCACLNNFSFEDALTSSNTSILSFMMAAFYQGFKDEDALLNTVDDYLNVLQELVDEGSIEHLGPGLGFICPAFKIETTGNIIARYMVNEYGTEQRFFNGTYDSLVFSKYVVLPGDEVKVVINGMSNIATVMGFIKQRTMLMLVQSYTNPNKLTVQERGFENIKLDFTHKKPPVEKNAIFIAEIVTRGQGRISLKIREKVKSLGNLENYIVTSVLQNGLPSAWPTVISANLDKIPTTVKEEDFKGRVDLRNLPLVTIDGVDAKDFDDAVYCEKVKDKFHLYVAIADVSYYVRPGSALDSEAIVRGNSVYFPYFVIPMLPEELSNGICSLNPRVDRLCMVCEMFVDKHGEIENYKFYPAVMNSHARLTYDEAYSMIKTGNATDPEHQCCVPWVKSLFELYQAFKAAREKRGAFEFEGTEVKFVFDEKWQVIGLEPEVRNEAHMLIEECMIAANICAATFVTEQKLQTLFRVHPRSTAAKLERLRALLSKYGIDLPGQDEPSPQDFKRVTQQVAQLSPTVRNVIGLQLLRSMSKATYNAKNIGHFGLALENYAHFTSPIRRYPDLQLHRVIKFILERNQPDHAWDNIGAKAYNLEQLTALGISCSESEVNAANAEFDVDNSLKCEYVKHFVSFVVPATVSAVTGVGVFVTLNDFYIDGRLETVYDVNEDEQAFTFYCHWLNKKRFSVGDQITVRIMRADPVTRHIELEIAPPEKGNVSNFDRMLNNLRTLTPIESGSAYNNNNKLELFDRLKDISRGKEPTKDSIVVRKFTDFGLDHQLTPRKDAVSGKAKKRQAFTNQLQEIKSQFASPQDQSQDAKGDHEVYDYDEEHGAEDINSLPPSGTGITDTKTKVTEKTKAYLSQTVAEATSNLKVSASDIESFGGGMFSIGHLPKDGGELENEQKPLEQAGAGTTEIQQEPELTDKVKLEKDEVKAKKPSKSKSKNVAEAVEPNVEAEPNDKVESKAKSTKVTKTTKATKTKGDAVSKSDVSESADASSQDTAQSSTSTIKTTSSSKKTSLAESQEDNRGKEEEAAKMSSTTKTAKTKAVASSKSKSEAKTNTKTKAKAEEVEKTETAALDEQVIKTDVQAETKPETKSAKTKATKTATKKSSKSAKSDAAEATVVSNEPLGSDVQELKGEKVVIPEEADSFFMQTFRNSGLKDVITLLQSRVEQQKKELDHAIGFIKEQLTKEEFADETKESNIHLRQELDSLIACLSEYAPSFGNKLAEKAATKKASSKSKTATSKAATAKATKDQAASKTAKSTVKTEEAPETKEAENTKTATKTTAKTTKSKAKTKDESVTPKTEPAETKAKPAAKSKAKTTKATTEASESSKALESLETKAADVGKEAKDTKASKTSKSSKTAAKTSTSKASKTTTVEVEVKETQSADAAKTTKTKAKSATAKAKTSKVTTEAKSESKAAAEGSEAKEVESTKEAKSTKTAKSTKAAAKTAAKSTAESTAEAEKKPARKPCVRKCKTAVAAEGVESNPTKEEAVAEAKSKSKAKAKSTSSAKATKEAKETKATKDTKAATKGKDPSDAKTKAKSSATKAAATKKTTSKAKK